MFDGHQDDLDYESIDPPLHKRRIADDGMPYVFPWQDVQPDFFIGQQATGVPATLNDNPLGLLYAPNQDSAVVSPTLLQGGSQPPLRVSDVWAQFSTARDMGTSDALIEDPLLQAQIASSSSSSAAAAAAAAIAIPEEGEDEEVGTSFSREYIRPNFGAFRPRTLAEVAEVMGVPTHMEIFFKAAFEDALERQKFAKDSRASEEDQTYWVKVVASAGCGQAVYSYERFMPDNPDISNASWDEKDRLLRDIVQRAVRGGPRDAPDADAVTARIRAAAVHWVTEEYRVVFRSSGSKTSIIDPRGVYSRETLEVQAAGLEAAYILVKTGHARLVDDTAGNLYKGIEDCHKAIASRMTTRTDYLCENGDIGPDQYKPTSTVQVAVSDIKVLNFADFKKGGEIDRMTLARATAACVDVLDRTIQMQAARHFVKKDKRIAWLPRTDMNTKNKLQRDLTNSANSGKGVFAPRLGRYRICLMEARLADALAARAAVPGRLANAGAPQLQTSLVYFTDLAIDEAYVRLLQAQRTAFKDFIAVRSVDLEARLSTAERLHAASTDVANRSIESMRATIDAHLAANPSVAGSAEMAMAISRLPDVAFYSAGSLAHKTPDEASRWMCDHHLCEYVRVTNAIASGPSGASEPARLALDRYGAYCAALTRCEIARNRAVLIASLSQAPAPREKRSASPQRRSAATSSTGRRRIVAD